MITAVFTVTYTDELPEYIIDKILNLLEENCSCAGSFADGDEHTYQFGAVNTFQHTEDQYVDFTPVVCDQNGEPVPPAEAILKAVQQREGNRP